MSDERKSISGQFVDRLLAKGIDWIVVGIIGGVLLLMVEPLRDRAVAIWNGSEVIQELRVEVASGQAQINDRLDAIKNGQDRNSERIAALTGDDRIIRITMALSYVEEPVRKGNRLFLRLFLARTALGQACSFQGGRSIFADDRGVPLPGSIVPVIMQSTADPRPLRVPLMPPDDLRAGKGFVRLELDYDCNGKRLTETTPDFPFILNP